MNIAIMQPYFLPYIGYFQLIQAVDIFVVYDNIKYTKKGWINRNRILQNNSDSLFSLPLKKASDFLDINQREIAQDYYPQELSRKISASYSKAPFFSYAYPVIQEILNHDERNLFRYIFHSIECIGRYLNIQTELKISSSIAVDHSLKSENRIWAICNALRAESYINAIGGLDLYRKEDFADRGIDLKFLKSHEIQYRQFDNKFVPWLSIVDVMMFNHVDEIRAMLENGYDLV